MKKLILKIIEKHSGEYKEKELYKKVQKNISYKEFKETLKFLLEKNKIVIDKEGKIGYIWNPKLTKKLNSKKEIKILF